ncbi:hypothetical protein HPB49_008504 [Dermacentor silvarum]|uniref:Uncharacterized protein n=1 Tax=Dermacentor silvarum TaxID=543639 RepID=A0ACB8DYJ2_DERSI|nr:hypothetical protein HPB49_008504 [Dermacentor silvarum]
MAQPLNEPLLDDPSSSTVLQSGRVLRHLAAPAPAPAAPLGRARFLGLASRLYRASRSNSSGPLRDTPRETALGHQSPSDFLQEEYSRINSDWISENLAGADLCSLEPSPRSQPSKRSASLTAAVEDPHLPTLAAELIEQVRSQTQLSHSLSRVAVLAVLRCLSTSLPDSPCPWEALLDSVLKAEVSTLSPIASHFGAK